jgi:hypothetical protein
MVYSMPRVSRGPSGTEKVLLQELLGTRSQSLPRVIAGFHYNPPSFLLKDTHTFSSSIVHPIPTHTILLRHRDARLRLHREVVLRLYSNEAGTSEARSATPPQKKTNDLLTSRNAQKQIRTSV